MPSVQIAQYQKAWVEGLNRGDLSAADGSFAADCIIHITGVAEPVKGVEAWKGVVGAFLTAFPDLHFTMEDQITVGDKVATRWSARGTHRGPLGPIPASGGSIRIDGLLFDRVVNGKVVERWEQFDQAVMLQQLGVQ
jgi:steroid delta-isomerase-like uncharacterized protein